MLATSGSRWVRLTAPACSPWPELRGVPVEPGTARRAGVVRASGPDMSIGGHACTLPPPRPRREDFTRRGRLEGLVQDGEAPRTSTPTLVGLDPTEGSVAHRDPGTGTYNGPLDVRNGFRTSAAHPVWQPVGIDQLGPHRAFRWLRRAAGTRAEPWSPKGATSVRLARRLRDRCQTRLARIVADGGDSVSVIDVAECGPRGKWQMTVPLDRRRQLIRPVIDLRPGRCLIRGQEKPFAGWNSARTELATSPWILRTCRTGHFRSGASGRDPK